jgi:hypothetical protein
MPKAPGLWEEEMPGSTFCLWLGHSLSVWQLLRGNPSAGGSSLRVEPNVPKRSYVCLVSILLWVPERGDIKEQIKKYQNCKISLSLQNKRKKFCVLIPLTEFLPDFGTGAPIFTLHWAPVTRPGCQCDPFQLDFDHLPMKLFNASPWLGA